MSPPAPKPREFSHPALWTAGLLAAAGCMGWVFFHWLDVGMQHDVIALVWNRAEDRLFLVAGIAKQGKGLVAVACQYDLIEAFLPLVGHQPNHVLITQDPQHRSRQSGRYLPGLAHQFDIAGRAAGDRIRRAGRR